jgi:4-hydroxy-tetrahydrodipicolinate synthase
LTDAISEVYQKGRSLNQSIPALKIMMKELDLCETYVLPPLEMCTDEERKNIVEAMHEFDFFKEYHSV